MTNLPTGLVLDRIPASLRTCPQWVGWRYITRGGKQTKAPVSPLGSGLADSTSADTWGTFDQAVAACQFDKTLAGIGFVFTADDPYCGVDLDNCIDGQGKLKPWAEVFVRQLDSYCEISPSGDGVKVFLKANKPGRRCRKRYEDGEVEIYDRDRFFTVTGRQLDGTASEINNRQEALDGVYRAVFGDDESCGGVADAKPATPAPQGFGVSLDDDEIIRLAATKPKTGAKFQSLWDGNWNDHYNSASEADSSVVFSLAYYSKDASQIDRLFRYSGLMRPKWDEMHGAETYGEITIDKALRKVTKQYVPKPKRVKVSRPPAPKPINTELPEIIIDDRQLSDLTAQALNAIKLANA